MIAAGLCMMGGCFAQDETTDAVDTYWPARSVPVPYTAASVGVYQYEYVPLSALPEDCHMEAAQHYRSGVASFFFCIQDAEPIDVNINFFILVANASNGTFTVRGQTGRSNVHADINGNAPETVLVSVNNGNMYISCGESVVSRPVAASGWIPETPCRFRILDSREGDKDFLYSRGAFGQMKWCVLAMRSALNTSAVFDFEQNVLVEL